MIARPYVSDDALPQAPSYATTPSENAVVTRHGILQQGQPFSIPPGSVSQPNQPHSGSGPVYQPYQPFSLQTPVYQPNQPQSSINSSSESPAHGMYNQTSWDPSQPLLHGGTTPYNAPGPYRNGAGLTQHHNHGLSPHGLRNRTPLPGESSYANHGDLGRGGVGENDWGNGRRGRGAGSSGNQCDPNPHLPGHQIRLKKGAEEHRQQGEQQGRRSSSRSERHGRNQHEDRREMGREERDRGWGSRRGAGSEERGRDNIQGGSGRKRTTRGLAPNAKIRTGRRARQLLI